MNLSRRGFLKLLGVNALATSLPMGSGCDLEGARTAFDVLSDRGYTFELYFGKERSGLVVVGKGKTRIDFREIRQGKETFIVTYHDKPIQTGVETFTVYNHGALDVRVERSRG